MAAVREVRVRRAVLCDYNLGEATDEAPFLKKHY